jgi:hypothetical protein
LDAPQFSLTRPTDGAPRCLACSLPIVNPPEAESRRRRGAFDVIVEWRICNCGAFSRMQRICRAGDVSA